MKVTSFFSVYKFYNEYSISNIGLVFVEFGKSIRLIFNQQEWESIPILFLDKSRLNYRTFLYHLSDNDFMARKSRSKSEMKSRNFDRVLNNFETTNDFWSHSPYWLSVIIVFGIFFVENVG